METVTTELIKTIGGPSVQSLKPRKLRIFLLMLIIYLEDDIVENKKCLVVPSKDDRVANLNEHICLA